MKRSNDLKSGDKCEIVVVVEWLQKCAKNYPYLRLSKFTAFYRQVR